MNINTTIHCAISGLSLTNAETKINKLINRHFNVVPAIHPLAQNEIAHKILRDKTGWMELKEIEKIATLLVVSQQMKMITLRSPAKEVLEDLQGISKDNIEHWKALLISSFHKSDESMNKFPKLALALPGTKSQMQEWLKINPADFLVRIRTYSIEKTNRIGAFEIAPISHTKTAMETLKENKKNLREALASVVMYWDIPAKVLNRTRSLLHGNTLATTSYDVRNMIADTWQSIANTLSSQDNSEVFMEIADIIRNSYSALLESQLLMELEELFGNDEEAEQEEAEEQETETKSETEPAPQPIAQPAKPSLAERIAAKRAAAQQKLKNQKEQNS